MQSVVTGQAPITLSFLLCSIYTEYYEALLGWNTRSRCADQICYPYVRLTLWKGECRWAFDCSDTVMVYILRILFFGSAHILLGRWIDTNDHMYIENLAVNKKQFPPFCQRFGGGVPLLVIRPILIVQCHGVVWHFVVYNSLYNQFCIRSPTHQSLLVRTFFMCSTSYFVLLLYQAGSAQLDFYY